MRFSSRSKIDSFIVMDVMEQARKEELLGRDIIHMEVGQPGTPAPSGAIIELTKKINSEPLGYTVALGIPELRKKISSLYKDWYGLDILGLLSYDFHLFLIPLTKWVLDHLVTLAINKF